MTTRAAFVVLAGIDGSGKDTVAAALAARCRSASLPCLLTGEPWRSAAGCEIRRRLGTGADLDPTELALLFAADRAEHLRLEVLPALGRGEVVVSTRYVESSVVYQGVDLAAADAGALNWVLGLNARFRAPDVTIVLDIPPAEAIARRRGARGDAYDCDLERLARTRAAYLGLAHCLPGQRVLVVDGLGTPDEVFHRVWQALIDGALIASPSPA